MQETIRSFTDYLQDGKESVKMKSPISAILKLADFLKEHGDIKPEQIDTAVFKFLLLYLGGNTFPGNDLAQRAAIHIFCQYACQEENGI